jgi:uncharacterized membrane protein
VAGVLRSGHRWQGVPVTLWQRLAERFWFVPALLCVLAAVAAEALIALDRLVDERVVPAWASVLVYRVGESGSRDVLGAIASSSLAVAGTTFSITMAVLALTSSSYGPRLVRNFMADRGNQVVLGVYVSTFLYSLLVLRSIRSLGQPGDPDADVFVPHLAVNGAVLLAVADVAVLVYFIHHISDSVQVSTLAGQVRGDLLRVVDRLYPADVGSGEPPDGGARVLPAPDEGVRVRSGRPGYVQGVRDDRLMAVACDHDVVVVLQVRPGEYVLDDTVLAVVHPPGRVDDEVGRSVRGVFVLADARSPHQDPAFAVQQLTEMAVRALSPGTNDPFTALNALDDLSVGLARLASRPVPSPDRYDDSGTLRVHAPRPDVEELVEPVLDSMRWYAASSPSVMHATLDVAARVGAHARSDGLRRVLAEHCAVLRDAFAAAGHHERDVADFAAHAARVRAGLLSL